MEKDPVASVLLIGLADGGLYFRVLWWSSPVRADYLIVQDRVLMAVHEVLTKEQLTVA